MTYYQQLKQYDDILFMYQRTKSMTRGKEKEINELFDLYQKHSGNQLDRGCSVCVSRAMQRICNWYFTTKESYKSRGVKKK
jgi:hypothetical protein